VPLFTFSQLRVIGSEARKVCRVHQASWQDIRAFLKLVDIPKHRSIAAHLRALLFSPGRRGKYCTRF
jgi:hypothetical protein